MGGGDTRRRRLLRRISGDGTSRRGSATTTTIVCLVHDQRVIVQAGEAQPRLHADHAPLITVAGALRC